MFTKFSKLVLFLAFPILALLVSCGEDDSNGTGPSTQKSYFPVTTGSWWIYFNYDIDSAGNKITDTEYYDTARIVGKQTINGKLAAIITSHNSRDEVDTSYFAFENNKLYTLMDFYSSDFFDFPASQWVPIADFNASSWKILPDTTLPPVDIPMPDGNLKLTATISIDGSKGGQKNITVKGKSIVCQEIINTTKMIMKFEIPGVPIPISATTNVKMYLYFGENIGLVARRVDPTLINVTFMQEWIDGSYGELVDYYIAP